MSESLSSMPADEDLPGSFRAGLAEFRDHNWRVAGVCFEAARRQVDPRDNHRNLYASYQGLSLVYLNDPMGLKICRHAAADEFFNAAVFANLAHAEIRCGHRRRAWEAVSHGLKLDAGHVGLRNLRLHMGVRREPVISFLSRDHILNRVLGRLTYDAGAHRRQPFRGGMV